MSNANDNFINFTPDPQTQTSLPGPVSFAEFKALQEQVAKLQARIDKAAHAPNLAALQE